MKKFSAKFKVVADGTSFTHNFEAIDMTDAYHFVQQFQMLYNELRYSDDTLHEITGTEITDVTPVDAIYWKDASKKTGFRLDYEVLKSQRDELLKAIQLAIPFLDFASRIENGEESAEFIKNTLADILPVKRL